MFALALVNALVHSDYSQRAEIAREVKLSARATRTRLLGLVGRRMIREVGTSPQDPRRRYFLMEGAKYK